PGAPDHERPVIVSDAFRDPQASRVVLVFVIEGPELDRAQPLDIPDVEEFMRDQMEPSVISAARARRPPAGHYAHRVAVFESATCFDQQIEEGVTRVGQRSEKRAVLSDQRLCVGCGARAIPDAVFSFIREYMKDSVEVKSVKRRVAAKDRRVDERIVTFGAIAMRGAAAG